MAEITLRKKIAQMLIMGFSGASLDNPSSVRNWVNQEGIGGVLLFDYDCCLQRQGKNLVTLSQIQRLTHELKRAAMDFPLFVAIDYEGGAVDRLKHVNGAITTTSPAELANLPIADFKAAVNKMAVQLKSLGFNLNFAPVVDLNLTEACGIIGRLGRAFSSSPDRVSFLAEAFVDAFAEQNMVCCYKHFPGHGSALGDTHADFVDVTNTFQYAELEPYRVLSNKNHLPLMIMTAHVINRELDSSGLPATLSKTMLTQCLRQKLGFEGVIISDDLQMHAIAKHYSLEEALELTINAGADMLIFANQLGNISASEVTNVIESLVQVGKIHPERIENAFTRIQQLKNICL